MKQLSLTIAIIAYWISVPVWIYLGTVSVFSGSILFGLLMIFVAVPVAIAHAVVFEYVAERTENAKENLSDNEKARDKVFPVNSPTRGTPWEKDPGHTI